LLGLVSGAAILANHRAHLVQGDVVVGRLLARRMFEMSKRMLRP